MKTSLHMGKQNNYVINVKEYNNGKDVMDKLFM